MPESSAGARLAAALIDCLQEEQLDALAELLRPRLGLPPAGEEPPPPDPSSLEPTLTVRDVAARVGVHEKTVRRASEDGRLTAYRPDGMHAIRVTPADVNEWALRPVPRRDSPAAREHTSSQQGEKARRAPGRAGSRERLLDIEREAGGSS